MLRRLQTGGIVLVPTLPVIGLFVYWTAHEGGYLPTTWEPSALVVLGLLVAALAGLGLDRLRLSRAGAIALGALAAYTAWSYLSITWAASPGDALDGSNRTLLYLLTFALFVLLPWREWTALAALTAFALALGVVAVVMLFRLGSADAVPSLFNGGRLQSPLGYVNATAAAFMVETVVAIALAARRELPAVVRALLVAFASAALAISILAESRGWLFALPVVVALTFALVPGRLRLALWSLPVAAVGLVSLAPLLDVFQRADAAGERSPEAAARALVDAAAHARGVVLPLVALAFAAGLALALADRRLTVPARASRWLDRGAAALAAAAVLAGVAVGFAATDGRPDRKIADYWDRSHGYQATDPGASRFAAVGSNRPDFWKVSWEAFAAHPVGGLGQDNWGDYYLRRRDSDEQPRWTHSLQLRLLAHTGLVGTLLFAVFLVAVCVAALRWRRKPPTRDPDGAAALAAAPSAERTALAAIGLLPLVVWLAHGSIDWFWEVPALSGPAFAFAGLSVAVIGHAAGTAPIDDRAPRRRPPVAPIAGAAALGALALLAAAVLLAPYLAEREIATASARWHENPSGSLSRLERAADLNPLSSRADMVAGAIALEAGRPRAARSRLDRALSRDPDNWFAHFSRGLAESALGHRAAARRDYSSARALTPDEALVAEGLERVDGRKPLTAAEAFARLRANVAALTGQP